jgi:hypothetical protein
LRWYSAVEAQRLLEQIEPDAKMREFHVKEVQQSRVSETRRILARTSVTAANQ